MKKILFVAIFLCAASAAFSQIRSATLKASGLTCSMCSKAIYKSLQKVPFIQAVQPDIEGSTYTISFRPGSRVELDEVRKAVENAGFSVAALQVKAVFPKTAIANDAHVSLSGTNLHFLHVSPQTIQGEQTFTVVDKSFLPEREHRKYGQYTKMACFQTGRMAVCCSKEQGSGRIYHITL